VKGALYIAIRGRPLLRAIMYYYFIQSVHLECGLIRGWSLARDSLYIVIRGRPLLRAIMYYYFIQSVHLECGLIRGLVFGEKPLIHCYKRMVSIEDNLLLFTNQ
jgi:hypothetical protein